MKEKCLAVLFMLLVPGFPAGALDPVRQNIINTARQYVGVPYVYGAASPAGFDCSGFVSYIYGSAGISLPRTARNMWSAGRAVRAAAAQPGDLIVFDTIGGAPSHVAILLDDETMIHAVSQGPRTGVIISSVQDRYFAPRIMGMRSFIGLRGAGEAAENGPGGGADAARAGSDGTAELLGITIPASAAVSSDRIPIARGSSLRFALVNGSGRDGIFEVLFYRMDPDPSKHVTIRQDRIHIRNNEMVETPSVTFAEAGQYRLVIKTRDNRKLVEKTWRVVAL